MNLMMRALLLMTCSIGLVARAQDQQPQPASLSQLQVGPENFDGKLIRVSGYLLLDAGRSGDRLYFHLSDFEQVTLRNSLRLERSPLISAESDKLNGNFVRIVGIFKVRSGPAAQDGVGELREIRSCTLLYRTLSEPSGSAGGSSSQSSTRESNQSSAVASLAVIYFGCLAYSINYGIGYPSELSYLGKSDPPSKTGAGLIDNALAGGVKNGYTFTYAPGAMRGGTVPTYEVRADPVSPGETGRRHYFMNQTGVIRWNDSTPAAEADPQIENTSDSTPNLLGEPAESREIKYNEAAAVGALRTLNTACVTYAATFGTGFPAGLEDLGASGPVTPHSANLIDKELASGTKSGYVYRYSSEAPIRGVVPSYTITADPVTPGQTGRRHFFTDQSGVIRWNASTTASASDQPIQ